MSLWLRVECRECGWTAQRLVADVVHADAELALQGCTRCGRKALELWGGRDKWLRDALVDAGLERD